MLTPIPTPHSSLALLTPHSSPLTPHSSLLTPHSSLLTPYPSLLTLHPSLLTPHALPPQVRCGFARGFELLRPKGCTESDAWEAACEAFPDSVLEEVLVTELSPNVFVP